MRRFELEDYVVWLIAIGVFTLLVLFIGGTIYSLYQSTQPIEIKQINQFCIEVKQGRSYSVKCVNSTNNSTNVNVESN